MGDVVSTPLGPVVWITGLSGAGKSSVAGALVDLLRHHGMRPVLLDGDEIRAALGGRDGFDAGSRRRLALTYSRLCKLLADQGHTVICATISLYHEVHGWNRAHLRNYHEVLLDVPVEELVRRDTKGIYASAGDRVIGLHLPAEYPLNPDLVLANHGPTDHRAAAEQVFNFCRARGAW